VGQDWGAAATYIAATLAPERLERVVTAAVPHLHRFLFWPTLRQLKCSRYMGFFQLRGIPERSIVANDFKWLCALIHEWSRAGTFPKEISSRSGPRFPIPCAYPLRLAYYRAMPRNLSGRVTWALLFTPIKLPARMIRGAHDGCIGPEMFEGQEKRFPAGFELMTLQEAGHFMHCEQPDAFAHLVLEFIQ
jgi:pimeloyl-ACP methyl ester carboxylesterase